MRLFVIARQQRAPVSAARRDTSRPRPAADASPRVLSPAAHRLASETQGSGAEAERRECIVRGPGRSARLSDGRPDLWNEQRCHRNRIDVFLNWSQQLQPSCVTVLVWIERMTKTLASLVQVGRRSPPLGTHSRRRPARTNVSQPAGTISVIGACEAASAGPSGRIATMMGSGALGCRTCASRTCPRTARTRLCR